MKELTKYNIDIYGLEERPYEFDYELGPAFFEQVPQDLIQKGHFNVHVKLEKSSTMIQLWFTIQGQAEVLCDRSLEPFDEPMDLHEKLILKFGDHDEELTEEIAIINRTTTRINVAGYIFEFIALALPMKKIHPDLREPSGDQTEEDSATFVYSSEKKEETTGDDDSAEVDPRWEALRKLKKG